jgi:hypothetical protein
MTVAVAPSESYDDYTIGDEVWTLAWLGMPFVVVNKVDELGRIELNGAAPCSLPEGAMVDINPPSMFMLTHKQWDQVWYWPDRAGEHYDQVVDRFIADHVEGEVITGYYVDGYSAATIDRRAMALRISFGSVDTWGQIHVQPVAAVAPDGSGLIRTYDPSIPDDQWFQAGPAAPARLEMHMYRWALRYGDVVLNWRDFLTS